MYDGLVDSEQDLPLPAEGLEGDQVGQGPGVAAIQSASSLSCLLADNDTSNYPVS